MTQGEQLSGSAMTTDADGRSQFVTYVSMEEFQRMTPAERERVNAAVGSSAMLFPKRKKSSAPISAKDLEELYPERR